MGIVRFDLFTFKILITFITENVNGDLMNSIFLNEIHPSLDNNISFIF